MKRYGNIWFTLIALLMWLAITITLICTGYSDAAEEAEDVRLVVEEELTVDRAMGDAKACIIRDTETGVRYLYIHGASRGGITKLEEAPGEEADR